jgi:hypothetical protein
MSGSAPGPTDLLGVLVTVHPDPAEGDEVAERLGRQLRAELSELDVESVRPAPGAPAPEGAKGADPVTVGAVLVALSASGGVFPAVVETIKDWLARHAARHRVSVTIDGDTLQLEKATEQQRQDVVDAFVRRHTPS